MKKSTVIVIIFLLSYVLLDLFHVIGVKDQNTAIVAGYENNLDLLETFIDELNSANEMGLAEKRLSDFPEQWDRFRASIDQDYFPVFQLLYLNKAEDYDALLEILNNMKIELEININVAMSINFLISDQSQYFVIAKISIIALLVLISAIYIITKYHKQRLTEEK